MSAETNRLPFSKTRLAALPTPDRGRSYFYDEKTPALALCVTAAGTRVFYHYKWTNGRPSRVRLGSFPEISVEQARKLATALNAAVAAGSDPQQARRDKRQEATLGELWQHWESHAQGRKKPRSLEEDKRLWELHLKHWESRRLSAIKRHDVAALHAKMGTDRPYAANRMIALLKAMYNKADALGYKGENPAAKVELFPEQSRERFLAPEELPRFFQALAEEPSPIFQGFFLLALLTGARRGNLQAMRWQDISFEMALWRIPAAQAKAGKTIVVPLVPMAIEALHKLRELAPADCPWVFPGRNDAKTHLTTPIFAWQRLCKRAGLEDLRIHDLRRSVGSWMAIGNAGLPIIGKLLGHTQPATTAVYARLSVDPVRLALTQATDAMLAHNQPRQGTPNGERTH